MGAPAATVLPVEEKEIPIYQQDDVLITNTKAMFRDRIFVMNNISSVRLGEFKPEPGYTMCSIGGAMLGVSTVVFLGQIIFGFNAFLIISLLLLIGGGIYCYQYGIQLNRDAKIIYSVVISVASGETNALASNDKDYIISIINAINSAVTKGVKSYER